MAGKQLVELEATLIVGLVTSDLDPDSNKSLGIGARKLAAEDPLVAAFKLKGGAEQAAVRAVALD